MKIFMPRSTSQSKIKPGESFYLYVNGPWIQSHHIEKWRSEYGASDEVEKATDSELLKSILSLPTTSYLKPTTATDHLRIFRSIWIQKTPSKEEDFIRICMNQLMNASNSRDIAHWFGWACKSGIPTLLNFSVDKESRPPYFIRPSISPGTLLLPLNYYIDPDMKQSDVWSAYIRFVTTCSIELGLPFLVKAIEAESELARYIHSSPDSDPLEKKGSTFGHWNSEFEWTSFAEGATIQSWTSRLWILNSPDTIQAILRWICKVNEEHVIAVLALHLIKYASIHLRSSIRDSAQALFGKALRGVSKLAPKNILYLSVVKEVLPSVLCTYYSEQQKGTNLKNIYTLVDHLRDSTLSILDHTRILFKRTRRQTLEKMHRMKVQIGKGFNNSLPNITYTPESIVHTLLTLGSETMSQSMKTTGHPIDPKEGIYPCFQVNASYYPERNEMVLPWGILQEPFYSKTAPIGWNYGGLGSVIGHEITHAFDLEGSLYNARAIFKDTWTRKNRNTFRKQTRKVSSFFHKFKHYNKRLDGAKTLSENWADLGGLKIALGGLNVELEARHTSPDMRREAYRNFFIAYATCWRTLIRKQSLLHSMMTSVHAPAEDRVDRIVPQFQEWVDAFDIQETDPLFMKPKDRLHFF